jgi:hypothetical protein
MVIKMPILSYKSFGTLEDDRVELIESDQVYKYHVFRDANGVEWHELVNQFGPFDYYIAVNDQGRIFSMESDPDQSQIGGLEIIGLKVGGDFPFTRGPGGNVYGKVWNGSAIVEPPVTEPIPDDISRRQFFQYLSVLEIISRAEALAAIQTGTIPASLQAIIDQLPSDDDKFNAQMFVVGAQNFNRLHWLTDKVRLAMQWTVEERDDFWRNAAKV